MGAESKLELLLGYGAAAVAVLLMSAPFAFPGASRRVHQFCFWTGVAIAVVCFVGATMVAFDIQMPTGRRLYGLIGMAGFGLAFVASAIVFAQGEKVQPPKIATQSGQSAEPPPTSVGPFGNNHVTITGMSVRGQVPEGMFGKNVDLMRGVKIEDQQEKPINVESPTVLSSALKGANLKQGPGSIANANSFDGDHSSTFEYEGKDGAFVGNQVTDYGHVRLKDSGSIIRENTFKAPDPKTTQSPTTDLPPADPVPPSKPPR